MKTPNLKIICILINLMFFAASINAQITTYFSVESATTANANTQDDSWRSDLAVYPTIKINQMSPPATGTYNNAPGVTYSPVNNYGIRIKTLDMDGGSLFGGTAIADTITISSAATMQAGSPKPSAVALPNTGTLRNHYNELIGSDSNRNAILFEFMDSTYSQAQKVRGFGAWFGDAEGRSDYTNATVRLFDSSKNLIASYGVGSDANALPTSPISGNQLNCNNSRSGCGNETTRWIGFIDNGTTPQVAYMLVIVGDEDPTGSGTVGTGFTEHLSFVGPTIAYEGPKVTLIKNCITPSNCTTAPQLPASDLTYKIDFTNIGGGPAAGMSIVDGIPAQTDYKLGTASVNTGATGLTFIIEYSSDYTSLNPTAATWTYTPVSGAGGAASGYDRSVKAIRWRVSAGMLPNISPNNIGYVSFVTKIK